MDEGRVGAQQPGEAEFARLLCRQQQVHIGLQIRDRSEKRALGLQGDVHACQAHLSHRLSAETTSSSVRMCVHAWALCLAVAVCTLLHHQPVSGFYGVTVPIARNNGPYAVPNVDCIFVYSCAPLTVVPAASDDPRTTLLNESFPAFASSGMRPVYVGRAAGRCQRRLTEFKCKIQEAVMKENECRAAAWPDEDAVPGQAAPQGPESQSLLQTGRSDCKCTVLCVSAFSHRSARWSLHR